MNNETIEDLKKELSEYQKTVQELQKSNSKMFDRLLKEHLSDINSKNKFVFENTPYAKAIKKNQELINKYKKLPREIISQLSFRLNKFKRVFSDMSTGTCIPMVYFLESDIDKIFEEVLDEYEKIGF